MEEQEVVDGWEAIMQAEDLSGDWNVTAVAMTPTAVGEGWVTKRELSEQLGVSIRLIELCQADGMPSELHDRKRYYDPAVAQEWMQARQRRMEAARAEKQIRPDQRPAVRFVRVDNRRARRRPMCVGGIR